jgi:hypothetical protein
MDIKKKRGKAWPDWQKWDTGRAAYKLIGLLMIFIGLYLIVSCVCAFRPIILRYR